MLSIDKSCIACDACRDVCPTEAISVGDTIYIIHSNLCVLCASYYASPHCINVCPVDAISDIPKKNENNPVLS